MAEKNREQAFALFEILRERDMPAYPDAAKELGIGYTDYLTGAGASAKGVRFATDPKSGQGVRLHAASQPTVLDRLPRGVHGPGGNYVRVPLSSNPETTGGNEWLI